jgi:hypothetical protein
MLQEGPLPQLHSPVAVQPSPRPAPAQSMHLPPPVPQALALEPAGTHVPSSAQQPPGHDVASQRHMTIPVRAGPQC